MAEDPKSTLRFLINQGEDLRSQSTPLPEQFHGPPSVPTGPFNAWKASCLSSLQRIVGNSSPYYSGFTGSVKHPDVEQTESGIAILNAIQLDVMNGRLGTQADAGQVRLSGKKVFLVHGHNNEAVLRTERFLQQLELETVVLRDEPNKGRTIIEKFVDYADVRFAVVLLTADDRGGTKESGEGGMRLRARQNVVLELGYFLAKLGRQNVAALYEQGVEIPSDYAGVLFTPMDKSESWQLLLAKEMKAAGLEFDMNKLA